MKTLSRAIFLLVTVCISGCSKSPEYKLKELSDSLLTSYYKSGKSSTGSIAHLKKSALLGNRNAQAEYGMLQAPEGDDSQVGLIEAFAWLTIAANDVGVKVPASRDYPARRVQAQMDEEGEYSARIRAEMILGNVSRRMNPDSVSKGNERASVIRASIVNEVEQVLGGFESSR